MVKDKMKKLFLCLCAGLITALALVLPFNYHNVDLVSAETVSTFEVQRVNDSIETNYIYRGSTIYVPFTPYSYNNGYYPRGDSSNGYQTLYGNFGFTLSKPSAQSVQIEMSGGFNIGSGYNRYEFDWTFDTISSDRSVYPYFYWNGTTTDANYLNIWVSCDDYTNFVPNIYKIREWSDWNSSTYIGGNHIRYYDVNDHYIDISITCWFVPVGVYSGWTWSPFGMGDRTYYLDTNLNDNQYYDSGYQTGYRDGLIASQDSIYDDGYSAGNTDGYNRGYQAGTEASNQYTFVNLISAVVDVPVRTFTSLFNFDLLGVNLATFFGSLLAVAVVITIVKLIL